MANRPAPPASPEPAATGLQFLGLGGMTRFGDGWVALGSGGLRDEDLVFDVRAFRSADGRTWSEIDTTGFDGPADVTGLTTVDGDLVAVGNSRLAANECGRRPRSQNASSGER
jgi:hypothetical protein